MKKVINFIKQNYIFSVLVIPFISVCLINRTPDNDIWFLLSVGRHVFGHGFINVEPLTIHHGLEYVVQQWGSAVSFWLLYDNLGKFAILFFVLLIFGLSMMVFYKICKMLNGNKFFSVILTACSFYIISTFIVSRPHIITYLLLLLEIYILEKYVKSNNFKYLIWLIPISILLINIHASMWFLLFLFLLPYIINGIYVKNISIDKYKVVPVLAVGLGMFIVGFINPYGVDSILYIFKSYNLPGISELIKEMKPVDISHLVFVISLLLNCLLILIQRYVKKFKLDIRHLCLIFGTFIMFVSHAKCFPYFILTYFISMSYGLRNVKIKFDFKRFKNIIDIIKALFRATCFMLCISFFVVLGFMFKYYSFNPFTIFDGDSKLIADHIINNYEIKKIRLFTYFDDGGYYEFRGLKTYIDPRAEVFFKKINGKEDIYTEYLNLYNEDDNFDYQSFLSKYNFTHLVVLTNSEFDEYLKDNSNYKVVYTLNYQFSNSKSFQKLYVLDSFSATD